MPIERAAKSSFAAKLAAIGLSVKGVVEADPDNLYGVRELCKLAAPEGKKPLDGYQVALAIGILWVAEEVDMEYRAGKLLVGAK